MSKNNINTKKGFTIIEVVLVLAIAGLIFLMVFLALPALQRSQRDTQRRDDLARLSTAITSYQTNNRGALPTGTFDQEGDDIVDGTWSRKTWGKFYQDYLLANGDTFVDPDGVTYGLQVVECGQATTDGECASTAQRYNTTFLDQDHKVMVVTGARCDSEASVPATGARNFAIVYRLEGGGTYCSNS